MRRLRHRHPGAVRHRGGLSENDRREHIRRSDPRMDQLRYRSALAAWERDAAGVLGA